MELPGIETEHLPGKMQSELLFRYVSFPFSPVLYLRFRFRVLTASRVVTNPQELPVPWASSRSPHDIRELRVRVNAVQITVRRRLPLSLILDPVLGS